MYATRDPTKTRQTPYLTRDSQDYLQRVTLKWTRQAPFTGRILVLIAYTFKRSHRQILRPKPVTSWDVGRNFTCSRTYFLRYGNKSV